MVFGMAVSILWESWLSARYWSAELFVIGPVAVLIVLWWRGRGRLLAARSDGPELASISPWRSVSFLLGMATILVALESPIDYFSAVLFWVHMVQHLLLLVVASPLIVSGSPWYALWEGTPQVVRSLLADIWRVPFIGGPLGRLYGFVRSPAATFALFTMVVWGWHDPAAYDLTLLNQTVHDMEHLSFVVAGVAFWLQVLDSPPFIRKLGDGGSVLYLVGAMGVNVVVSVALGLSQHPWYAVYAAMSDVRRPGGVSELWDQQFGAGIMWTLGDLPFSFTISRLVLRWLEPREDLQRPHETRSLDGRSLDGRSLQRSLEGDVG